MKAIDLTHRERILTKRAYSTPQFVRLGGAIELTLGPSGPTFDGIAFDYGGCACGGCNGGS